MAAYVRHQADLLERVERSVCPDLDLNVMMSELDAIRLQQLAPGTRTLVVPNGVDVEYFVPQPEAPQVAGRVVFVGPTYGFPNRDAVEFLLAEVWPLILGRRPDASLSLIGRNADADRVRYAGQTGVSPQGHVADLRPHLAEAACCVVPIRVGGGTRLKILDAWALGREAESSPHQLDVRSWTRDPSGENILIRMTRHLFAGTSADS